MKLTTRQIALSGIVAALYAAITILAAPLSYGFMQFRIADAMCLLVCIDIIIGTAATLLGCLLTIPMKKTWLLPIPTILANALMVGAMLAWVLTPETFWQSFVFMGAQVAFGELVVLYVLGVPLYLFMKKSSLIERLLQERR